MSGPYDPRLDPNVNAALQATGSDYRVPDYVPAGEVTGMDADLAAQMPPPDAATPDVEMGPIPMQVGSPQSAMEAMQTLDQSAEDRAQSAGDMADVQVENANRTAGVYDRNAAEADRMLAKHGNARSAMDETYANTLGEINKRFARRFDKPPFAVFT